MIPQEDQVMHMDTHNVHEMHVPVFCSSHKNRGIAFFYKQDSALLVLTVTAFFSAWYKQGLISKLFMMQESTFVLINLRIRISVPTRTQEHAYISCRFTHKEGTWISCPSTMCSRCFSCMISLPVHYLFCYSHVEKPDGLFPFVASFIERGQA